MTGWSALGPGTRVLILVAGGAGVAGAGYLGWRAFPSDPVPVAGASDPALVASDPETTGANAVEPPAPEGDAAAGDPAQGNETASLAGDGTGQEAVATADSEPMAAPGSGAPVIDTWRVDGNGEAVVSGSAAPGATVAVLVDGSVVASGPAAGSGEFALLFTLPPNPKPSLMWLEMTPEGGTAVASEKRVALGAIKGPDLAVAEAPSTTDAGATGTEALAAAPTEAPAALLLSDEGAVILQDPDPEPAAVTASVMIDTITYTPEGEVQVGGRAAAGAALRLYLDNAEKLTLAVPADGLWVTTLPDIQPGVYTLRVDQMDGAGKVTSRFETPFKRETLADLALAATEDAAPAPGAGDQAASAATSTEVAPDALPDPAAAPDAATGAAEPEAVAEAVPAEATASPVTITVQPGFTLWGIAADRMGDGVMYVQVFEANRDKIKDPDLIYPGQVFTMPAAASP
jgi:nucleoid-associated protein YgaU